MSKFLNETGLAYLWGKITTAISDAISGVSAPEDMIVADDELPADPLPRDADTLEGHLPSYFATVHSFSGTITTTWVGASAPYTQDVTVSGILAADRPHVTPVYDANLATALFEEEAYGLISEVEASDDDTLTFTCFGDKPVTAINIAVEVIR